MDLIDPEPKGPALWACSAAARAHERHRQAELARLAAMPGSLRALAQTCHDLRSLILPRSARFSFVTTIDVETIAELGYLREALRLSPELSRRVQSFDSAGT